MNSDLHEKGPKTVTKSFTGMHILYLFFFFLTTVDDMNECECEKLYVRIQYEFPVIPPVVAGIGAWPHDP